MLTDDQAIANPYAPPTAPLEGVPASSADAQPYMLPCSTLKLLLLSAATFNLYLIYWFWKNFRHEQRRNPEISAVLRTIFSGIFFYTLARSAADEADTRGLPARYSSGVLTAALWVAAIVSNQLPDPWSLLVFLFALILVPVQRTVNRINRDIDPALGDAERFRGWEIALVVPGGLLLLLAIAGTFMA
jgi:hypothetical protein